MESGAASARGIGRRGETGDSPGEQGGSEKDPHISSVVLRRIAAHLMIRASAYNRIAGLIDAANERVECGNKPTCNILLPIRLM
jgi:hypothetical protein